MLLGSHLPPQRFQVACCRESSFFSPSHSRFASGGGKAGHSHFLNTSFATEANVSEAARPFRLSGRRESALRRAKLIAQWNVVRCQFVLAIGQWERYLLAFLEEAFFTCCSVPRLSKLEPVYNNAIKLMSRLVTAFAAKWRRFASG